MSLPPGTRLGVYEVVAPLGAGGMGEVYRGRDTRLDRIVAIKVLAPDLAADPQFRERFDREAKAISQLNHPNICTLYDVGDHESVRFLVLEFLEGETLAARLEQGALKLEEALKIAGEISGALDQAHRAGIVHRDLKPGNIMLTRAGAKLLDFGLAKQTASPLVSRRGSAVAAAASGAVTADGAIVGTFQYMAPEQLEGAEADARADIFAFGAILYEMVTGRKAFEGKTPISLITSILRDEPMPIATLLPVAPRALDRLIRACMAKDPDTRLRSTHDLSLQLKWLAEGDAHAAPAFGAEPAHAGVPAARGRRSIDLTALLGGALSGVVIATIVMLGVRLSRQAAPVVADAIQFTLQAPENSLFSGQVPTFTISPDGRHVVFIATTPGVPMLFVRSLGTLTIKPLAGTENANYPFWSPDSRFVAFFSAGKLRKVPIGGGSPVDICDAAGGRGGTWNADNTIVFAPSPAGALERVAATGGTPAPVTTLDAARGETMHRWPQFLPDGRHFLFLAPTSGQRPSEIRAGTLDSKETSTVIASDSMPVFATGHLFFWRNGKEMAQPFDPGTLQVKGDAFVVADQVGQNLGYTSFSASSTGVLVYSRLGARPKSQLTWFDRSGKKTGTVGEPGDYFNLSLSPEGKRVAVTQLTGTPENRDIWLIDLARSVSSRLTADPANDVLPIWSPDGSRVVFTSTRQPIGIYVKDTAGAGQEELLLKGEEGSAPIDWSSDGKFILYFTTSAKTGLDLNVLPTTGDKKPFPFLSTTFNDDHGAFSPDVRWVAYTSNESGRDEVYVQPFPATGGKYRISQNGGTQPAWRGDGRELFFLAPDSTLLAATINTAKGFEADIPQALFNSGAVSFTNNKRQYAVAKDGRFLVNLPQQRSAPTPLTVVVNWQAAQK
jgi:Tol biopolymer transport system component